MRQKRKKMTIYEYEPLSVIGCGAFGEVRVCRNKITKEIVAIKKMKKDEMIKQNQLMHIRTEKEILTVKNPWIINLKASFQDAYYLYLVMDFCGGGDFMNLLIKREIINENDSRFYITEMILAVDAVHKLNCIHRDLKPDNILIDNKGHLKLSDFGLCKISDSKMYPLTSSLEPTLDPTTFEIIPSNKKIELNKLKRKNRITALSLVRTIDYIAPEVYEGNGYGMEIDWWSLGVILYEMMIGYPAFFSQTQNETKNKIMNWKKTFSFPSEVTISKDAMSLIRGFITIPSKRLGYNGIDEIKRHPFFHGFNWDKIQDMTPPFVPVLSTPYDNRYFDHYNEKEPFYPTTLTKEKDYTDINYEGYTFNRDNETESFSSALEMIEVIKRGIEEQKKHS